jgi:hypothetical protein
MQSMTTTHVDCNGIPDVMTRLSSIETEIAKTAVASVLASYRRIVEQLRDGVTTHANERRRELLAAESTIETADGLLLKIDHLITSEQAGGPIAASARTQSDPDAHLHPTMRAALLPFLQPPRAHSPDGAHQAA